MTLHRAKEIADDPNKPVRSLAELRKAASVLDNAGWAHSADNIYIHLRLRRPGPMD